ncbi:MAG TPA: penicillin-binding protein activator [Steroidobacteraceae bacterium]|jgi:outer membrane PBP1 activator LpoA protein|nr:penicillin-binding protein activator [Steroidobacteraceae bacterium]
MYVRSLIRLALVVLTAMAVSGCPSLSQRTGLPPSIDRAQELERSGDPAGAARVYEELATQNSGTDRTGLLLHAARDYLAAQRADEAARVLGQAQGPFSPEQVTEQVLLNAQLALARGQPQEALRLLNAIAAPAAGEQAARYRELHANATALAAGHPGATRPGAAVGPHIALLLPITGRAASAAISVRDGFMTAYYQLPANERPRVQIYDSGSQSVADALTQATGAGADFIVGPLTREEVTAAADFPGLRTPLLALNFLPPERAPPSQFYQYALSPEDEARLVARRVLEDHHRRGVALVPAGDWGTRVLAAFRQELQAGGGDLIGTGQIDSARTDYSAAITEVLRISDSTARFHRLESILGTKLQFEPRRRNDIEFIFAPAPANLERLLRPQLRFHFAGDIPTYATSDAFEPDLRANEDLEGLMFPDMPWMLGGDLADAVRAATREAWPAGGPHRGRLFAFGFDAFRLAQALRHSGVSGTISVPGLTGRLSLDAQRHVRRELGWAQLHDGELRLLPLTSNL